MQVFIGKKTHNLNRILPEELFGHPIKKLIKSYRRVLEKEVAGRNQFNFPAKKAHKRQRRASISALVQDLRTLTQIHEQNPEANYPR